MSSDTPDIREELSSERETSAKRDIPAAIPFGNRRIGAGEPVLIIAEIGINHEGDSETCARMVEAAVAAGADSIKLQTSDPNENYAPGTGSYEIYSKSQLTPEETAGIFRQARELGVEPFTTTGAFTLEWVERLKPTAYKISSGLLGHLPFIRLVAKLGRPLLMSTGMSERGDIDDAVKMARAHQARHLGLFQCTSLYPASEELLNLSAIRWLEEEYDAPAGLSDHSDGVDAAAFGVAAGARMIEKHFSLDPTRAGFDHRISLNAKGFRRMVAGVRRAEAMMGSGRKTLTGNQATTAMRMKRYLVAFRDIPAGTLIGPDHISVMRVAEGKTGLLPKRFDDLVGVRARRDVARFQPFPLDFLERERET